MKALIITCVAFIFVFLLPPPTKPRSHPGVSPSATKQFSLDSTQFAVTALQTNLQTRERIPIGKEIYVAEIKKYDWDSDVARAIAQAESGCTADRRGDGHLIYYLGAIRYGDSWGLFQVRYLPGRPTPEQLTDYKTNVAFAYLLYKSKGTWTDWTVYLNGDYINYLGGKGCQ